MRKAGEPAPLRPPPARPVATVELAVQVEGKARVACDVPQWPTQYPGDLMWSLGVEQLGAQLPARGHRVPPARRPRSRSGRSIRSSQQNSCGLGGQNAKTAAK